MGPALDDDAVKKRPKMVQNLAQLTDIHFLYESVHGQLTFGANF